MRAPDRCMAGFLRFGASAAIFGGVLRIASSFIPYAPESAALETLYALIDLGLLFGLMAIGVAYADALGRAGAAALVVAIGAIASIVGPDARMFGIDFYQFGGAVFTLGLAGFALALLRTLPLAAALWLVSTGCMLAAIALESGSAFFAGGLALGAGFVATGLRLLTPLGARVAVV